MMKTKSYSRHVRRHTYHPADLLPQELGRHFFGSIRRNIATARSTPPPAPVQLTFSFVSDMP